MELLIVVILASFVCKVSVAKNLEADLQRQYEQMSQSFLKRDFSSHTQLIKLENDIISSYQTILEQASDQEQIMVKRHQKKVLKVLRQFSKKNSHLLEHHLSNGLSIRETFLLLQKPEIRSSFVKIFKTALSAHKQAVKQKEPSNFHTQLQDMVQKSELHQVLPYFGPVLYSCLNDGSSLNSFTMHLLVFGRMGCDWIEELTVGPGLMFASKEAQAYFCIGTSDGFKGIGVTAGASVGAGIEVGTYIGAYGVCLKVSANARSVGARAGLSFIHIDQSGLEVQKRK